MVIHLSPKTQLLYNLGNWWKKTCVCHNFSWLSDVMPNFRSAFGGEVWEEYPQEKKPYRPWLEGCSCVMRYVTIIWRLDLPGRRAQKIHLLLGHVTVSFGKIRLRPPNVFRHYKVILACTCFGFLIQTIRYCIINV